MSNLEDSPLEISEQSIECSEITLKPRKVKLTTRTGIEILRLLPHREIRMIGAWCFLDYYGPTSQVDAMSVAAHPHSGLQTVSWLFSGEIEHSDSLQSRQRINPGELNIMTAGAGIAHSELSISQGQELHGVQLWVALPDKDRKVSPRFSHYGNLPEILEENLRIKVIVGEFNTLVSPAERFSELVALEINFIGKHEFELPLRQDFEYGILVVTGNAAINGENLPSTNLRYFPPGHTSVKIDGAIRTKLIVLGGVPFTEEIVMWWNFIARTHEEIISLREEWQNHSERYPAFVDQIGGWIPAPVMPNIQLTPRGNRRIHP